MGGGDLGVELGAPRLDLERLEVEAVRAVGVALRERGVTLRDDDVEPDLRAERRGVEVARASRGLGRAARSASAAGRASPSAMRPSA